MPAEMSRNHIITPDLLPAFIEFLHEEEKGDNTIQKYVRYTREFLVWLNGAPATKAAAMAWKDALQSSGKYAATTVNAKIASINAFFKFAGWEDCQIKALRLQHRVFRDTNRDLTVEEYRRLVDAAAAKGDHQLALVMETLCATGIRVSELKYITVEAVNKRQAVISLKGKVRTIIIPGKLCRKLQKYIRKNKIASGEVFLTRSGKGMSRRLIWEKMKRLCQAAGVEPSKVFPHNLRHLFAQSYYTVYHDIAKLADIMGHSCMETTRIYLVTTGAEHARQMDKLGLVS